MKKIVLVFIFQIIILSLYAQGSISGKVTNAESGEELIGATVLIKGTTKGAMVDIDGNYRIANIEAGTHQIICSYISFESDTVEVTVIDGENTIQNCVLKNSAIYQFNR